MHRLISIFLLLWCFAFPKPSIAAPAAKTLPAKAPSKTPPASTATGIVVCEPVTAPETAAFGSGCALWLQWTIGGQPQLGATPLWSSPARARAEMRRANLQLSSTQAVRLASILGITHTAVGTFQAVGTEYTLTYRLLRVPSGTAVGTAITRTGTKEEILAALPQVAQTLAQRLGVSAPAIPASVDLTPAEIESLGSLRWASTDPTGDQQKALAALAARNPLAGLMYLSRGGGNTNTEFIASVKALTVQAGDNPLIWGEIAMEGSLALIPYGTTLDALSARFPKNYNLAQAETFRHRALHERDAESKAATRAVQDAPRNPEAWLTYAWTISSVAADVRQGRFFSRLTSAEAQYIGRLYPYWEEAARRATQLDPAYGKAWVRLATAATFNGDMALADHALQTALVRDPDKSEVYTWGLQMYQPKWGGTPSALSKIAHTAALDTSLDADQAVAVAAGLRSSGSPALEGQLLSAFITRRRVLLAAQPNNGAAHWGLALVLHAVGDEKGSIAEYQTAATLMPDNAVIPYELGGALYGPGTYEEAIAEFQEALKLDPDYSQAHFYLGYGFKHLGRLDDAERELRTTLQINPASAEAYGALGDVFALRKDFAAAAPNYEAAIHLGAYTVENYENLVWALGQTGQYDAVLTTGQAALRVYPDGDEIIYDDMADALLHKKEWSESVAMSQAALTLDANDAVAHENLGEAYLGLGRMADARTEWKKVLTMKDARMAAVAQGYLDKYPQ